MRHRRKRILWSVCGVLFAAFMLWVFLVGFTDPPVQSMSMVHDALRQARSAEAPAYARNRFRQAEDWLRMGEEEMARQNGKLRPFRSYVAADSLFGLARDEALAAAKDSRNIFANLKSEAHKAVGNLQKEIQSRRRRMNDFLVIWDVEKLLASANLRADIGNGLLQKKEYKEALTEADSGLRILARLDDLVDKYSSEQSGNHSLWDDWVKETIAHSRQSGNIALIVDKLAHKLFLFDKGRKIHAYDCELGYNSARQKLAAGDGATPEGKYTITSVRTSGSKFYKALMLNYPNERDKKRFAENKAKGVVRNNAHIGGLIEIHGHGGQDKDWTDGCVALTNTDMDHLMKFVRVKTPVTIVRRSDIRP